MGSIAGVSDLQHAARLRIAKHTSLAAMPLLHFILNIAALLLWVNWRGLGFKEYVPYRSTLIHTLRSAAPQAPGRWRYLAALFGLLAVRGMVYQQIGSALKWVPTLDLGVLAIPFRSDQPWRMMLFSFLSFAVLWIAFQLCLILFSLLNRSVPDAQPVQHLVRLHLGRLERWPVLLKLLLPALAGFLWLLLSPLLVSVGLLPSPATFKLVAEQACLIGLASVLAWKPVLLAVLLAHIINSYVHLGRSPLLDFASDTARNLLKPFHWLPLCWCRIDFAPALLGLLIWAVARGWELALAAIYLKLPL